MKMKYCNKNTQTHTHSSLPSFPFTYLHRASLHSSATLTEVFPCFFLSCKANARVKPAKMGHGPHSSKNVCVVLCNFCVQMCTVQLPPGGYPIAVNKYIYHIISCNVMSFHIISYISYHIIYHVMSCHFISCHIISYHISYHIRSSNFAVPGHTLQSPIYVSSFPSKCPVDGCTTPAQTHPDLRRFQVM
jgi:hypothetical protein